MEDVLQRTQFSRDHIRWPFTEGEQCSGVLIAGCSQRIKTLTADWRQSAKLNEGPQAERLRKVTLSQLLYPRLIAPGQKSLSQS